MDVFAPRTRLAAVIVGLLLAVPTLSWAQAKRPIARPTVGQKLRVVTAKVRSKQANAALELHRVVGRGWVRGMEVATRATDAETELNQAREALYGPKNGPGAQVRGAIAYHTGSYTNRWLSVSQYNKLVRSPQFEAVIAADQVFETAVQANLDAEKQYEQDPTPANKQLKAQKLDALMEAHAERGRAVHTALMAHSRKYAEYRAKHR